MFRSLTLPKEVEAGESNKNAKSELGNKCYPIVIMSSLPFFVTAGLKARASCLIIMVEMFLVVLCIL